MMRDRREPFKLLNKFFFFPKNVVSPHQFMSLYLVKLWSHYNLVAVPGISEKIIVKSMLT